jgi:lysophospholipase L1-like esterase
MTYQVRALIIALILLTALPAASQDRGERWVATWATALVSRPLPQPGGRGQGPGGPPPAQPAPVPAPATAAPAPPAQAAVPAGRQGGPPAPPATVSNQTLRQIVHTSIGGNRIRVVLSNAFGTAPITIGAANVALREKDADVAASSVRPLTFGGQREATILAGATLVSDSVTLTVGPLADLAVDLFIPNELGIGPSPVTTHNAAWQTNYISTTGNHSGVATFPISSSPTSWFLLARVEVAASARTSAVVAFGDSITDGSRSSSDTNSRWPDVLARRLAAERGGTTAVLNAGIGGNRVLGDGAGQSALARFDKDVLMQTGATHVVVMEGINDIGIARSNPSPSAADLIAAHKQLIERAHARGLKIYGATLTPFEGAAYYTAEGEAKRQALNEWIRTSKAYDGVIDFDKVTRDPAAPAKFLPLYDSGDHLHPGDAGYKAMGEAVDLALFK